MKFGKRADILFNIIIPLLLGIVIYLAGRTISIPSLVRNYLPDGLWAYAFLSAILIIWGREINLTWIAAVFLTSVGFEILQYEHKIAGTGDIQDIITYFIAFSVALRLNTFFKSFYPIQILIS